MLPAGRLGGSAMIGTLSYVLLRGVVFVLLACFLLIDPVAAPAAFRDDDGTGPRDPAALPVWEDAEAADDLGAGPPAGQRPPVDLG